MSPAPNAVNSKCVQLEKPVAKRRFGHQPPGGSFYFAVIDLHECSPDLRRISPVDIGGAS
jgi:hypothetical protein